MYWEGERYADGCDFFLSSQRLLNVFIIFRHGILHHICSLLAGIEGIPEIWKTTGRPCIPRIIFSFQVSGCKGVFANVTGYLG